MKGVTVRSLVFLVLISSAAKAQSFGPEQVLSADTDFLIESKGCVREGASEQGGG